MQLGQIVEFKGQDRAGLVVGIMPELVRVAEYIKQGRLVILRIVDILKDSGIVEVVEKASNVIQTLFEDLHHLFRRLPDVLDINGVEYHRTLQPKAGRKGIDRMFYMTVEDEIVDIAHEVEAETMTKCRSLMRDLLKAEYSK